MKFTEEYLEDQLVYMTFESQEVSRNSCFIISAKYPEYFKQYQKMIKHQFKINPNTTCLWEKRGFSNESQLTILRVMLLQAFEQAILNGEIK